MCDSSTKCIRLPILIWILLLSLSSDVLFERDEFGRMTHVISQGSVKPVNANTPNCVEKLERGDRNIKSFD